MKKTLKLGTADKIASPTKTVKISTTLKIQDPSN